MSHRQDVTFYRVILATKTHEIRYDIDAGGAEEEAEESQETAPIPSSGSQPIPAPAVGDPSLPEESSSPPK